MSRLKPAPAATRPSLFSRGAGTVVKVRNELYREEMEEEAQYEEEVEYEEDYPIEEEEEEEEVEYVAVRKKLPTTTQKSRLAIKPTIVQRAASPPPVSHRKFVLTFFLPTHQVNDGLCNIYIYIYIYRSNQRAVTI